jgi:pilus assembly protein CpaE
MGRNHQILLVDPDVDHRAQLKSMLGTLSAAVVGEAAYGIEAARLAAELQPDIVLVRVEEPLAVSLRTLELVQAAAPRATPLVVTSIEEIGTVHRVMLAGARGLVGLPTSVEALDRTLQMARARHAESLRRAMSPCPDPTTVSGNVLTIFGPKGGVGKTTLATNLAVAVAQHTGARVALVDVDAYFGDVAIAMGVEGDRTMPDLLAAVAAGHEVDVNSYLVRHESGVHVLPARHSESVEAQADPDAIASVLRRLAASFDFLIVDTPGTFNPQVAAALDESTTALLVTSADIASVKDARMSLHALQREGFDEDRLKLVVNHATNATSVTDGEVSRAVGYEVFWTFPHDRAVPNSTQRGEPLVLSQPRARLTQEVCALAAHFGGTPIRAPQASMFGLFRRRGA